MSEVTIRPNSKSRHQNIEITCYGEGMIMVDHPVMPAPLPIGPSFADHRNAEGMDGFWDKSDEKRLEDILDHLDAKIDWEKSDPDILLHLGKDISKAREGL